LENVVRKILLLSAGYTISVDHVRAATARPGSPPESAEQTLRDFAGALLAAAQRSEVTDPHARLLEAAEREIITQAIRVTHGNQLQAARLLGISRLTLRDRLTEYNLGPGQPPES